MASIVAELDMVVLEKSCPSLLLCGVLDGAVTDGVVM
jgi:hypothetical protein